MNSIKWNTDPWDGVLVESNTNFSFLNFDFFSQINCGTQFFCAGIWAVKHRLLWKLLYLKYISHFLLLMLCNWTIYVRVFLPKIALTILIGSSINPFVSDQNTKQDSKEDCLDLYQASHFPLSYYFLLLWTACQLKRSA